MPLKQHLRVTFDATSASLWCITEHMVQHFWHCRLHRYGGFHVQVYTSNMLAFNAKFLICCWLHCTGWCGLHFGHWGTQITWLGINGGKYEFFDEFGSWCWHMDIERNCVLMSTYECLDEFMLWFVWFVFQCQLMKVQGCMMLTWTCKNVIWQHMKCQHVRMWDVNMWNVDKWECEMSTCESMRIYYVNFPWIWECMSRSWHPMDLRTCITCCQLWELALHDVDFTRFLRTHADVNRENAHCVWLDVRYAWTWECAYIMYDQMSGMQELSTSHGFENMQYMLLTLRTHIAWCQLYKVFENARWCWHRECALCTTGNWIVI